jgi:hypothetical protein
MFIKIEFFISNLYYIHIQQTHTQKYISFYFMLRVYKCIKNLKDNALVKNLNSLIC